MSTNRIGDSGKESKKMYAIMDQSNILSNDWKELIIEDSETKQKLVIINNEGVEITSSKINVRLIPKR